MKKTWRIPLLCLLLALAALPALADGVGRDNVVGTVVIANGDSVRVRAGSDADTEQIGLVNPGEQYDCVGVAPNGWYEIIYPTGRTGFVSGKLAVLLRGHRSDSTFSYPVGTVYVSHSADVRTRNGGDGEYSFMGSIHSGETYPCVGLAQSGWPAILLDNGWIVYVASDLTTLRADTVVVPNPIAQSAILAGVEVEGIVTITNEKSVNVRSGGSADWPILASARPGDTFLYVGRVEDSSWLGILLPDGQVGYVAPGLAELTGK